MAQERKAPKAKRDSGGSTAGRRKGAHGRRLPTGDPSATRVQYAVRQMVRIATLWGTNRARREWDDDTRLDGELLAEIIRLVESREKSAPTGEGQARSPDAGMRHAVMMLSDRIVDMLEQRGRRDAIRWDAEFLEALHGVVAEVGFEVSREEVDARVKEWRRNNFIENPVKDADGDAMLARHLVAALGLERGTGKSTQFKLKKAFEDPGAARAVRYRDLARFALICLGVKPRVAGPLSELLDSIHSGRATWDGDRALAPLKEALKAGQLRPRTVPASAFPSKPANEDS